MKLEVVKSCGATQNKSDMSSGASFINCFDIILLKSAIITYCKHFIEENQMNQSN